MLLAIDVGNTNVVFALLNDDDVVGKWRISTDVKRTTDEYAIILKDLMGLKNVGLSVVKNVVISTVVPQNLFVLKSLSKQFFACEPIVVGEAGTDIGMEIEIERPSEVGADRIVNAIAAYDKYQTAAIVIDFGTATTFDVISTDGKYIGGVISPGINLSIEALHKAAAKLPEIAIKKPDRIIGKSTISAMQSGIYFGYVGLIEGIISRIKAEYSLEMTVIATGGLAPLFADSINEIDYLEEDLTIAGLKKVFEMNNNV